MNKKGDAVVYLVLLFSLFFVGIYYAVMTQAHDTIFSTINSSVGGFDSRVEQTNNRINTVWTWLPLIFLIGFILWAIVHSVRSKEYGA